MLASETRDTSSVATVPTFGDAVTPMTPGKKLHGEACSAGPEEDPWVASEQWCLPFRRQHAGRPASGSEANADGGISDRLNRVSNAMARTLRTTAWYIRPAQIVNAFGVIGIAMNWEPAQNVEKILLQNTSRKTSNHSEDGV